nr:MAG TPA: hypothetical protein [Caudoviricetes sp.]
MFPASSLLKSIRSSLETFFCLSNLIMNSFLFLSIELATFFCVKTFFCLLFT